MTTLDRRLMLPSSGVSAVDESSNENLIADRDTSSSLFLFGVLLSGVESMVGFALSR